jgi:hypothetical protein
LIEEESMVKFTGLSRGLLMALALATLAQGLKAQDEVAYRLKLIRTSLAYIAQSKGYGYSVCISQDGSTMVASSTQQGGKAPGSGSVAVFEREGNEWKTRIVLAAEKAEKDDFFGMKTSISSDGSMIAIGAPGASNGNLPAAGKIFVYERPQGGWSKGAGIKPIVAYESPEPEANQLFGNALALDGTGEQLAVGIPLAKEGRGAVYVFKRPKSVVVAESVFGELLLVSTLGYGEPAPGDLYGSNITISADGQYVAAGAIGWQGYTGMVLVYKRGAKNWEDAGMAKLAFPDHFKPNAAFGGQLAISGDGTRLAIGASGAAALYMVLLDWGNPEQLIKTMVALPSPSKSAVPGMFSLAISSDGRVVAASDLWVDRNGMLKDKLIAVYACDGESWKDKDLKAKSLKLPAWSLGLSGDGTVLVAGDPRLKGDKGEYQAQKLGPDLSPIQW